MIATILTAAKLAIAIRSAWPDVPTDRRNHAALALAIVDDPRTSLLASIAYHETRLTPWLVGKRGECGIGQVKHRADRKRLCADAAKSYVVSFRQMTAALDAIVVECRGRSVCVLNVYAAGSKARNWRAPGKAAREFRALERQLVRAINSGPVARGKVSS